MNTQEMQEKYKELYAKMASSQKPEYMKLFGKVMTEMMHSAIQKNPSEAQQWIEELGAIEWKNYLTPKEAETIVTEMIPDAPWSRDTWNKAMDSYGLLKEEMPYYNSCALWVMMNAEYVKHGKTLEKMLGMALDDMPTDELLKNIQMLALDSLKSDGVSIRHMYGV